MVNYTITQAPRKTPEGWETVLHGENGVIVKVYAIDTIESMRVANGLIKPVAPQVAPEKKRKPRKAKEPATVMIVDEAVAMRDLPSQIPPEDDVLGEQG